MEIVTKIAPIALALIMLGLGLGLSVKDFTRVIRNPKDFLIMIIAAAPGGVTSNVLTKFADGDVALSISLTAVGSLISIILQLEC